MDENRIDPENTQEERNQTRIPTAIFMTGYNAPAEVRLTLNPETIRLANAYQIPLPEVTLGPISIDGPSFDLSPLYSLLAEIKSTVLTKDDIPTLSRMIGNDLVGESFLRWDSQVKYYPTLTLIFLESESDFAVRQNTDPSANQRKVQIKTRVVELEQAEIDAKISEDLIKEYSKRCGLLKGFSFESGNLRCTYVSEGRCRWKTTIFVDDEESAHLVLSKICSLLKAKYNRNDLTVTKGVRSTLFSPKCTVTLHKATLFINKIGKPIQLFPEG